MRVTLAGGVEFLADDGVVGGAALGAPARTAAAYLVVERHRPVAREELADVLWGDDLPQSWKQLVRGVIAQIRIALREVGLAPQEALRTAFGCYQLQLPDTVEVDIERVARDLSASLTAHADGDDVSARARAASAARVAARGFLPGAHGGWCEAQQSQLRDLHLRALEALATACVGTGDHAAAVDTVELALTMEPYRESLYAILMRAQVATGNGADAIRTYERCRLQLREHLGVSPSPATDAEYLDALGAEPADVVPERSRARDVGVPALPARLRTARGRALVGRVPELTAVLAAVGEDRPSPAAVFVTGEAGVGKTRLVAEVAARLRDTGAHIVFGSCVEEDNAFEPFVRMATELGTVAPHPSSRDALLDAIVTTFAEAAATRPLVLVVDDIQWSSATAVVLLRRLLRASVRDRLIVLATARDGRSAASTTIDELFGEIARMPSMHRIALDGLDVEHLADLIRADGVDAVRSRAAVLAPSLHDATSGNVFFAREVIRHWNDGATGVPPAVVDAVQAERARLPTDAGNMLTIAAVVGLDFDVWSVRQLTGHDDDVILGALEQARRLGLVAEADDGEDRWSFVHSLVREALLTEVSAGRRSRLHTRLGLALARSDRDAPQAIASHLLAGTADHRADAIPWLVAAASRDTDTFAFESAVATYERALAVVDTHADGVGDPDRLALFLGYATALLRAGMRRRARVVLRNAADLARELGDARGFAEAALATATSTTPRASGQPSPHVTALLEEARALLPDERSRLRAHIDVHLGIQHLLAGDERRGWTHIDDARATAVALADADTGLLVCAAEAGESPDPIENVVRAQTWLDASQRVGDGDHETWARINLVWSLTAAARLPEALVEARRFEARARRLRLTAQLWWPIVWDASRAVTDGRFGDAEAALDEANAIGIDLDGGSAAVQLWLIRAAIERLTGGIRSETVTALDEARGGPESTALRALDTYVRWHTSERELVAEQLRRGKRPTTTDHRDGNQLAYTNLLAEAVAGAGCDDVVAREAYKKLAPYAGRLVVLGYCGAVFGAVDRTLGLLASSVGDEDLAQRHFDAAALTFAENDAAPWSAIVEEDRAPAR